MTRVLYFLLILLSAFAHGKSEDVCPGLLEQYRGMEMKIQSSEDARIPMCAGEIQTNCAKEKSYNLKTLEMEYRNLVSEVEMLEGFGKIAQKIETKHASIKEPTFQDINLQLLNISEFSKIVDHADMLQSSLKNGVFWQGYFNQSANLNDYLNTYCDKSKTEFLCQKYFADKDQVGLLEMLNQFANAESNYRSEHKNSSETNRYSTYAYHLNLSMNNKSMSLSDYKKSDDFKRVADIQKKLLEMKAVSPIPEEKKAELAALTKELNKITVQGSKLSDLTPSEQLVVAPLQEKSDKINALNDVTTGLDEIKVNVKKTNENLKLLESTQDKDMTNFTKAVNPNGKDPSLYSNYRLGDAVDEQKKTQDLRKKSDKIKECLDVSKDLEGAKKCYTDAYPGIQDEKFQEKLQKMNELKALLKYALNEHPVISQFEKMKILTVKALQDNYCSRNSNTLNSVPTCGVMQLDFHQNITSFSDSLGDVVISYENQELQDQLNLKKEDFPYYFQEARKALDQCSDKESALCKELKKEKAVYQKRQVVLKKYEPMKYNKNLQLDKPEHSNFSYVAQGALMGGMKALPSVMQYYQFKKSTSSLIDYYNYQNEWMTNWNAAQPDIVYIKPWYEAPQYQENVNQYYWKPTAFDFNNLNFGTTTLDSNGLVLQN